MPFKNSGRWKSWDGDGVHTGGKWYRPDEKTNSQLRVFIPKDGKEIHIYKKGQWDEPIKKYKSWDKISTTRDGRVKHTLDNAIPPPGRGWAGKAYYWDKDAKQFGRSLVWADPGPPPPWVNPGADINLFLIHLKWLMSLTKAERQRVLKGLTPPLQRRDPLVLDLDGDGIETLATSAGTFFDHDGDGFAEQTGWVGADDGLLVRDASGDGLINDGRELFGDETILRDGTRANNGFEALADLDANNDRRIDENDAAYSEIQVWQDADGDGVTSSSELYGLQELGISAIHLDAATTGSIDPQGNTQDSLSTYERMDGRTAQIGAYSFHRETFTAIAEEWFEVPEEVAVLPELHGYGTVRELHQEMAAETTGELKSLVVQFAEAGDPAARDLLVHDILATWTRNQSVAHDSRGPHIDGRKLAVLERFSDESFSGTNGPNPTYRESIHLNDVYALFFEAAYSSLMAQTHLQDLYNKIVLPWDEETQPPSADLSAVIQVLKAELDDNPQMGKQTLAEFSRSLRGLGIENLVGYMSFREEFIQLDPDLGWVIDTGGLPVIDGLGQGRRWWSRHMMGTDNAEAIKGSLTVGDGWINGEHGNDVIYGTSRNELLYSGDGDALIVAGGGNDRIWAGPDDDILDGGAGNDTLRGERGNDTYIFRRGSGQDVIIDPDPTEGNTDTIWLGSNLTPDEIALGRSGNNLALTIGGTADRLTVKDFFRNNSPLNRIEHIQFMDGTLWTDSDIGELIFAPTEGDDVIWGGSDPDSLSGLGGNDTLYGLQSDDILVGGTGADRLYGGTGADTYVFDPGHGQDTIFDGDTAIEESGVIEFGSGISPDDMEVERLGDDLRIINTATADTLTVKNWVQNHTPIMGVASITSADGAEWDIAA